MRIISDFKDYYDSAQGFGTDPNLLYVRKLESFEFVTRFSISNERKARMPRDLDEILRIPLDRVRQLPHSIVQRIGKFDAKYPEIPIAAKLIGFCGFLHPAIEIDGTTFYATDQISSQLSEVYLKRFGIDREALETSLARKAGKRGRWYWGPDPLSHDSWLEVTKDFLGKRFDEIFVALELPAFKVEYLALNKRLSVDKIRCTLNPFLKADEFQKIKGPAEAFQEISMYLGNQLARQPDPASDIPDEIRRDEKGFDKWSFRRHKEEDKKYRKNQH